MTVRAVPKICVPTNKDVPDAMKASSRTAAAQKVPVETSELVLQAKIVILEGNQRMEAWFPSAKHLELLNSGQHC